MQLSTELPVRKVEVVEINIDASRKQYKFGDIENSEQKNKGDRLYWGKPTVTRVAFGKIRYVADATFRQIFFSANH